MDNSYQKNEEVSGWKTQVHTENKDILKVMEVFVRWLVYGNTVKMAPYAIFIVCSPSSDTQNTSMSVKTSQLILCVSFFQRPLKYLDKCYQLLFLFLE